MSRAALALLALSLLAAACSSPEDTGAEIQGLVGEQPTATVALPSPVTQESGEGSGVRATPPATNTPAPTSTPVPPTATKPPPPTATPVPPTPVPPPPPTATPKANCDPSYPTVCIPPYPPDLDCKDVPYKRFQVLPPDPHRFDADKDGIGCES